MAARNRLLKGVLVAALLLAALPLLAFSLINNAGGNFTHDPEDAEWLLGDAAAALVEEALSEFDAGELRDFHTHLIGHGEPDQARLNARLLSWLHPLQRLRTAVFMDAAGVDDFERANEQYLARLVRLVRATPGYGRHYLLAFDHYHDSEGVADPELSEFYVSNDYVYKVSEQYPDLFLPAVSIHPYRPDAIEALREWAGKGVRLLKWLPNSQGIDPADPRLLPFFEAMARLDITLLSHAGEEQAVQAGDWQHLGNPLRLRQALDAGVKVIVAHAASLGTSEDLDAPQRPQVDNLQLFLRMMDERNYNGLLFGEISSITQFNRIDAVEKLLQRPDLHHRLVNGSDYPLPAVNVMIRLAEIAEAGLLQAEEIEPLREVYGFNPLLFDLVTKRSLRLPGTELGFAGEVFTSRKGLAAD